MKLILENWRGYLVEAEKSERVEDIMGGALDHLVKSLSKVKGAPPEEEIDEVVGVAIAGVALAMPQILEIVGETINRFVPLIRKAMGDVDASNETEIGNRLIAFSHKWHEVYMWPLRKVASKLFPDKSEEWVETWTKRLFHLIVAAFLVGAGIGAVKALAAGKLIPAILEAAMAAVKSDEIGEFLFDVGAAH